MASLNIASLRKLNIADPHLYLLKKRSTEKYKAIVLKEPWFLYFGVDVMIIYAICFLSDKFKIITWRYVAAVMFSIWKGDVKSVFEENRADASSLSCWIWSSAKMRLWELLCGFCRSSNERMRWVNLKQLAFKLNFIFFSFGVIGFVLKYYYIFSYPRVAFCASNSFIFNVLLTDFS